MATRVKKATITHKSNYRPPRVHVLVNGRSISPGREDTREDTEEESEWPDDFESQVSSQRCGRGTSPLDSHIYDENFDELQNHTFKKIRARPTQNNLATPDPGYSPGPYQRYSTASSNAPGGQAVPYGSYRRPENLFRSYPEQLYNFSPQYYPPPQQNIPLPSQFYPQTNLEIDSLWQELEDLKTENREREKRREEKEQAEESRRKRKQAKLRQKRKEMEEKDALKRKYEARIQEMKADHDKKIENVTKAAGHHDQPIDLHGSLGNFLPAYPAAGHSGYGYGYSAAPERQAHPNRWFGGQGSPTRYHDDYPSIDDLYSQLGGMKRCLYEQGRILGTLLPHEQWAAGPFADGEYHMPVHPVSHPSYHAFAAGSNSYQPDYPQLTRRPRMRREGGFYVRGSSPFAAVFSGIEEPAEDVGRRPGYGVREYVDDGDDNDGNLAPAAVAAHYDEHQPAGNTFRNVRRQQLPLHRRPRMSGKDNATRATRYSDRMGARRLDAGEDDGIDSGHSSDVSDEVEECKHRPNPYVAKPDARFRREVFQARGGPPQPFDHFTDGTEYQTPRAIVPTPPLTADEDFVARPHPNRVRR